MKKKYSWGKIYIIYASIIILINLINAFNHAFWVDEVFTIMLLRKPFGAMLCAAAGDVHPPLYYILIKVIYWIFGENVTSYRIFSLIPLIVVAIFSGTVIRKKFGEPCAFSLISFWGLLESARIYNVEVRMYSFGMLFTTIAFYYVYKLINNGSLKNFVIFTLSAVAAMYSHYYALVAMGFLYLSMLVYFFIKDKKKALSVILSGVCALIAYMPWLFIFLRQLGSVSSSYWITEIPSLPYCVFYLFYNYGGVLLVPAFAVALFLSLRYDKKTDGFAAWMLSGAVAIAGTIVFAIAFSKLIQPILVTKYLMFVSSIAWMMFSVCLAKLKNRNLWAASIVALLIVECIPRYYIETKAKNDLYKSTETMVNVVNKDRQETDAFATDIQHLHYDIITYYYDLPKERGTYYGAADVTDILGRYPDATQIWYFSSAPIDSVLDTQDCTYSFVAEGAIGGSGYYSYLYKIEPVGYHQ